MNVQLALQESMERFVQSEQEADAAEHHTETCMDALAHYLLHYSDLYQEPEGEEEPDFAEWEHNLEEQMVRMLEGDVEPALDLGQTPLAELDPEHIRDFIGWFVLRESGDPELIEAYAEVLRRWFAFMVHRGWWQREEQVVFEQVLDDVVPEAVRTARAARVFYHFVRSGGGVPPRLRGQRFSEFAEGHARVTAIRKGALWFAFDNHEGEIGPVALPKVILDMVAEGDVFDLELGLRGDAWVLVDVGPIYPACVYVEAEEYQDLDKIS